MLQQPEFRRCNSNHSRDIRPGFLGEFPHFLLIRPYDFSKFGFKISRIWTKFVDRFKQPMLPILLDISAAFDMIDIEILLPRLESEFGIIGSVALWIRSYLTDRECYVAVGGSRSVAWRCREGVPQGSVLGPLIFSGYVSPIARIFDHFSIQYHQYADDTQLYTTVKSPADQTQLISCVEEVTRWFLVNGLLLNASKTKAIAFGTRQQLAKRTDADGRIAIGGTEIVVSEHIKILGVHLDSTLSMNVHTSRGRCKGMQLPHSCPLPHPFNTDQARRSNDLVWDGGSSVGLLQLAAAGDVKRQHCKIAVCPEQSCSSCPPRSVEDAL